MRSCVGGKQQPRWLWEALDHHTGRIVVYTFGRRTDQALVKLKTLLDPLGIRRLYTDGWGTYRRHLDPRLHRVSKRRTQQLERKHLALRTRINRLQRFSVLRDFYKDALRERPLTTRRRQALLLPRQGRTKVKIAIVRKTLCFSKSVQLHELVIGLFINRFACGVKV